MYVFKYIFIQYGRQYLDLARYRDEYHHLDAGRFFEKENV